MKRILYIPFDHLNKTKGVLKDFDKNDLVVLVESKVWPKELFKKQQLSGCKIVI
jgi:3-deoxy-D-manno-octulosonic-acid transferase